MIHTNLVLFPVQEERQKEEEEEENLGKKSGRTSWKKMAKCKRAVKCLAERKKVEAGCPSHILSSACKGCILYCINNMGYI